MANEPHEPTMEKGDSSSHEPVPTEKGDSSSHEPVPTEKGQESEAEVPMVSLRGLFQYASKWDAFLMWFGGISAFIAGASMPAFSEIWSRMTNDLSEGSPDVEDKVGDAALLMVYVGIGTMVFSTFQVGCWMASASHQMARIRSTYFHALMKQEMAWQDQHKPGELSARLSGDTRVIQAGINDTVANLILNLSTALLSFAFGFWRSWRLTLVMLSTMPLIAAAGIVMNTLVSKVTSSSRAGYAQAGEIATEVLENIKTVQVYGAENREVMRFFTALAPARAAGVKQEFTTKLSTGVSYATIFCTYGISFWWSVYLVNNGYNNVGEVVAVFFAVITASFSVGLMFPSVAQISAARAAALKVYNTINRVPLIDASQKGVELPNFKGNIEFRHVKFSYPTRKDYTLFTDLCLTASPGQTVAFSGASGCGKSSIVALLERFYDPDEGCILVDGVDLRTIDINWWHDQVGIVSQEPNLFSGSVLENVKLGKPSASMEEVERACKLANIHDTIMALPQPVRDQRRRCGLTAERGAEAEDCHRTSHPQKDPQAPDSGRSDERTGSQIGIRSASSPRRDHEGRRAGAPHGVRGGTPTNHHSPRRRHPLYHTRREDGK